MNLSAQFAAQQQTPSPAAMNVVDALGNMDQRALAHRMQGPAWRLKDTVSGAT